MSVNNILVLIAVMTVSANAQHDLTCDLQVAPSVDLHRYTGTWYEIARMPNTFQSQCVGDVTATYSLNDDGSVTVVNRCRTSDGEWSEATGKAKRAADDEPNTKLKVRFAPALFSFLPFVWGDYWILLLAPDYSYAVIGEPSHRYLWILSRTPVMEDSLYQEILTRLSGTGYNLSKLQKTPNTNY